MRHWIVQRQDTVEAIIEAIKNGECTTERQVEAIATRMGDSVTWAGGQENEYRIRLTDANGAWVNDHIYASSAQEAADKIRKEYGKCYIIRIAQVVNDWK